MRGALLRNLHLCARNLHFPRNLKPKSYIYNASTNSSSKNHTITNAQILYYFPSRMRFFSCENENPVPNTKSEPESSASIPEEEKAEVAGLEDVDNKDLKTQLEDYFQNSNEEALPKVFESVLKRKLLETHEDTDEELMDELQMKPLDDVNDEEFESDFEDCHETDEEFESDFEDCHETDEEIEDLYTARENGI